MDQLPVEVLSLICVSLPRPYLKELRTSSPKWRAAVDPAIFRELTLRFNLKSFDRMTLIADSEHLRKHVRALVFDPRIFPRFDVPSQCFAWWVKYKAGQGLGLRTTQDFSNFVNQFSQLELMKCYENYTQHMAGQNTLLEDGNSRKMLAHAMSQFSALKSLTYSVEEESHNAKWPSPDILGPIAREILMQPQYVDHQQGTQFWDVLELAVQSGFDAQPVEVSAQGLDLEHWSAQSLYFDRCWESLHGLQSLTIDFFVPYYTQKKTHRLREMLSRLPSLKCLNVSSGMKPATPKADLIDVIPANHRWHNLETLSLKNFKATQASLQCVLSNHANTLRSLALSSFTFQNDNDRPGSWPKFFEFMNDSLSLDRIYFNQNYNRTAQTDIVLSMDLPFNDQEL